jgi:hypothetical protein
MGSLLRELGDEERAASVLDEVVDRYGRASEAAVRAVAGNALLSRAGIEAESRPGSALTGYDEVVSRYADDTAPELQLCVTRALLAKGRTLQGMSLNGHAAEAYGQVVKSYGDDQAMVVRTLVAEALLGKGDALAALGRAEDARDAYLEVTRRCRDASALEHYYSKAEGRLGWR